MLCRVIEQLVPDKLKSHVAVIIEDNLVINTAVWFCRTSGSAWHFHIPHLKPLQHCF